jgi:electron transport complex protein RnfC
MLERFKVGLCAECGCCAYVCPSKRQLVQRFQLSKKILRAHKSEQKALTEKKARAEEEALAKQEVLAEKETQNVEVNAKQKGVS